MISFTIQSWEKIPATQPIDIRGLRVLSTVKIVEQTVRTTTKIQSLIADIKANDSGLWTKLVNLKKHIKDGVITVRDTHDKQNFDIKAVLVIQEFDEDLVPQRPSWITPLDLQVGTKNPLEGLDTPEQNVWVSREARGEWTGKEKKSLESHGVAIINGVSLNREGVGFCREFQVTVDDLNKYVSDVPTTR